MKMSKQHFDFIADTVGPMVGWPSQLHDIADKLAATNPRFDREKFINRACKAWEDNNPREEINDEIPY